MATAPTPIDAAPSVPISTDHETTFDAMFEAFLTWLKNTGAPGISASASSCYANALEVYQATQTVAAQAAAAQAAVGAQKWVEGNYTQGDCRWSPTNGRIYRRLTAGTTASATDPALDAAGWWDIAGLQGRPVVIVGAGTTVAVPDRHYILTSATSVLQLPTTGLYAGACIEVTDISVSRTAVVDPQTNKIRGGSGTRTLTSNYFSHVFQWSDNATYGWI